MASTTAAGPSKPAFANAWTQLIIGIVCMVMIANYQYGWTLFVGPLDAKYHWGRASIQIAFTIFVLLETWLVPVEGYLVDRFGPRWIVVVGGVLCGIAWAINSVADSLAWLYIAAALAGIGAGGVYGTCIGNAVKWFPGRRGLAAGLTAMGFGAGAPGAHGTPDPGRPCCEPAQDLIDWQPLPRHAPIPRACGRDTSRQCPYPPFAGLLPAPQNKQRGH